MIAFPLRILLTLLLSARGLPAGVVQSGAIAASPTIAQPTEAPDEKPLPKEVMGFQGKVSGTVVQVDVAGKVLTLRVAKAEPHPTNHRAPKPDALHGMTIAVTPLEMKPKTGPSAPEAKAAAYIAGALPGDAVVLDVRTSSKGKVFRLLKVPAADKK